MVFAGCGAGFFVVGDALAAGRGAGFGADAADGAAAGAGFAAAEGARLAETGGVGRVEAVGDGLAGVGAAAEAGAVEAGAVEAGLCGAAGAARPAEAAAVPWGRRRNPPRMPPKAASDAVFTIARATRPGSRRSVIGLAAGAARITGGLGGSVT
ncbi:hypothetical protein [Gryllotalpicola sp.]|uniref:hypothetical protein n=1 Tax=Gryllotalpicola sp. TaxID=1932787 RepID=UPI00262B5680|nr:hypothetical protein [Gryllotalpicola sp.]